MLGWAHFRGSGLGTLPSVSNFATASSVTSSQQNYMARRANSKHAQILEPYTARVPGLLLFASVRAKSTGSHDVSFSICMPRKGPRIEQFFFGARKVHGLTGPCPAIPALLSRVTFLPTGSIHRPIDAHKASASPNGPCSHHMPDLTRSLNRFLDVGSHLSCFFKGSEAATATHGHRVSVVQCARILCRPCQSEPGTVQHSSFVCCVVRAL